jgi:hypothetical protein
MLMCSNGTFFKSKGIKVRIKSFQLYWHFQKNHILKYLNLNIEFLHMIIYKKKINI